MRYAAVAAVTLALAAAAVPAAAKEAKCLLEYKGETYINGMCEFKSYGNEGSFSIATPEEKTYETGEMIAKFAAIVDIYNGQATGSWSGEPYAYHVHNPLGQLRRSESDRACWVNDAARVCAW